MNGSRPDPPPGPLLVVGRGRLGRGLARRAREAGLEVRLTSGRAPSAGAVRRARIVLLAVPDPAIEPTAERIAALLRPGIVVLHAAGRLGTEPLGSCARAGAAVGVLHPLVSFADPAHPPSLEGSCFVAWGSPEALRRARPLVEALGARWVRRPAPPGPAYHAAAALLANGAVALAHGADRVFEGLGFRPWQRRAALASLLRTVADNLERMDPPAALSGPARRGDAEAVGAHLAALDAGTPETAATYRRVLPAIVACARAAGLSAAAARRLLADRARDERQSSPA